MTEYAPLHREDEVPEENPTAVAIMKKVSDFFVEADSTLTNGQLQQVGIHQVAILSSPAAYNDARTLRSAYVHGAIVATHLESTNATTKITTTKYMLHGMVGEKKVTLGFSQWSDGKSIIETTDPFSTSMKHIDNIAISSDYKVKLGEAFGIPL